MSVINTFLLYFLIYNVDLTNSCSNDGYPFEYYLSTKTPYRMVSNNSFSKVSYPGCFPKKIWMIVRHGTRNPNEKYIVLMKTRLPEIRTLILNSTQVPNEFIKNRDLDLFRKWKFTIDVEDDRKLTLEGEEEMLLLAERMQSRFPVLFDSAYSNTSYTFKYTRSQRTAKSAYYFASGLFGKRTAKDVWYPPALTKDPILRFYKLCDNWKKNIKDNPEALIEAENFKKGPQMKETVDNVNSRLGFAKVLNSDDVILIYRICGFETAWNKKKKSPWCSLLTIEDFKVVEYVDDLKYYWQDGYGYELAYKQACPTFADMNKFLKSQTSYPKVSVYFTHSGTLLKLMAHVGLNKDDEHLTANNYPSMADRKFRTSKIDSFATNLAFVLFNCGSEYKVLTMHQENIVRLPACPESDLCDLDTLNNYYSESINNCDFTSICKLI